MFSRFTDVSDMIGTSYISASVLPLLLTFLITITVLADSLFLSTVLELLTKKLALN